MLCLHVLAIKSICSTWIIVKALLPDCLYQGGRVHKKKKKSICTWRLNSDSFPARKKKKSADGSSRGLGLFACKNFKEESDFFMFCA